MTNSKILKNAKILIIQIKTFAYFGNKKHKVSKLKTNTKNIKWKN